jgi:hypothetical protein
MAFKERTKRMTAKETLWSVILIIVMAVAVYFGNIAKDNGYDRSMEIYDIRDESERYDSKINILEKAVPNLEGRISSLNDYIEIYRGKVREQQKELSPDAYWKYRRDTGSSRTYEDYITLINFVVQREVDELNEIIARREKLEAELEQYKARQIAEIPVLKREREQFNNANARQIDRDIGADRNVFYYIQAFWVVIVVMCFMILMKICTPFRYVVYSIAAVATVNHISNKFKGE